MRRADHQLPVVGSGPFFACLLFLITAAAAAVHHLVRYKRNIKRNKTREDCRRDFLNGKNVCFQITYIVLHNILRQIHRCATAVVKVVNIMQ